MLRFIGEYHLQSSIALMPSIFSAFPFNIDEDNLWTLIFLSCKMFYFPSSLFIRSLWIPPRKSADKVQGDDVMLCKVEQIVFLGPNTNMNTICVQKFGQLWKCIFFVFFFNQQNRNTIIIWFKKLTKYEYNLQIIIIIPNTKTNNMSTKTIKSSNKYWIQIQIIFGFEKIMPKLIRIYSVMKNQQNINMNSIWFENICRIWIQISLFGLN